MNNLQAEKEICKTFDLTNHHVSRIHSFTNPECAGVWVTLEKSTLSFSVTRKLKEKGYYIMNHEHGPHTEDKHMYLIVLDEDGSE